MASNQSEYDSIGSNYVDAKKTDIRKYVEHYTVHNCMLRPLLDDHGWLTGKRVLDLGCGHANYTRRLKTLNCAYILGVDISSTMVELARDAERQDPKHIEYLVADVKTLPPPEQPFDLVTAFYLFDHARTREELVQMIRTIYAQLGENKQFIGVTGNSEAGKYGFKHRKYGVVSYVNAPLDGGSIPDGTEIIVTLYNQQDEPICTLTDYYYSLSTYEQVFKEAGFKTFKWVPFQLDPDAPNKEFYDDFFKCPHSIGVMATK